MSEAKSFVTPERLPATASATKFHSLRCYFQVMLWKDMADGMEVTEWGWNYQYNSLIPVVLDSNPALEALIKMIHCNCQHDVVVSDVATENKDSTVPKHADDAKMTTVAI